MTHQLVLARRRPGRRGDRRDTRAGITDHPVHRPCPIGGGLTTAGHRRTGAFIGADGGIQRPLLTTGGDPVALSGAARPTRPCGLYSPAHRFTTRRQRLGRRPSPISRRRAEQTTRTPERTTSLSHQLIERHTAQYHRHHAARAITTTNCGWLASAARS